MLYNKVELKGIITYISELKKGKKVPYINGFIQTYSQDGEKKFNFMSIAFIAYNELATKIDSLELQKNSVVIFHGSLQDNNYNDTKTTQLIISSVTVDSDKNVFIEEKDREYHPRNEEPKKPEKEERSFTIDEDDLPF